MVKMTAERKAAAEFRAARQELEAAESALAAAQARFTRASREANRYWGQAWLAAEARASVKAGDAK